MIDDALADPEEPGSARRSGDRARSLKRFELRIRVITDVDISGHPDVRVARGVRVEQVNDTHLVRAFHGGSARSHGREARHGVTGVPICSVAADVNAEASRGHGDRFARL